MTATLLDLQQPNPAAFWAAEESSPHESCLDALRPFLCDVATLLTAENDMGKAIRTLTDGLRAIKESVSKPYWTSVIIPAARAHAVGTLIYQCPLTRHARNRPRGYPGDAELLDLIYRHRAMDSKIRDATAIGQAIFDITVAVPACESVRERRRIVAGKIDKVATETVGANILSLACGHLREAELSQAVAEGCLGQLVAVDQDALSLASVENYAAQTLKPIQPRRLTVRDVIAGRHDLPRFDLIYSIGLYDYLSAPMAERLTRRLFDLLNSGGTLLLANFLPGIWEAPYMEAYMDWHLAYRSESQIRTFLSEIPAADIAAHQYWTDFAGRVGYVEARRA